MRQMSLAQQAEFQRFAKKSRRERFLEEMDAVMSWSELLALISPHYPRDATLDWLLWYNASRMHSTLNYLSPTRFEQQADARKPAIAA